MFRIIFRDLFDVQLEGNGAEFEDGSELNDSASDSGDSICSDIDLTDDLDDDQEFTFDFPKNSICVAHSLQLVIKEVFDNCEELKTLKKVCLNTFKLTKFYFRKSRQF